LYPPALVIHGHDERRGALGMNRADQCGQLVGDGVVAREEDAAAHQRMAQQLALLGGGRAAGEVDHQGAQTHAGGAVRRARRPPAVSSSSDSTCVVCGNMSTTPAAWSAKPCSCTSTERSRARLPGRQEIYNTRCGASAASAANTAAAPVRGGSSSTWV